MASVWGKAGRAATATDPAPTEMFETVINLKPESEWRPGMTIDKLIAEMDKALQFPGVSQRLDHADQGAHRHAGDRHPHAGRRQGARHRSRRDGEARAPDRGGACATVPGTTSAFAERVIGGYYLDIEPDRAQLARYGLMIGDVQDVIATALGAEPVTTTVEGRERYAVSVRYPRDCRSDPQAIATRGAGPAGRRRHRAARPGRQGRAWRRGRPASAPRTRSSRSTSLSISATATSAAMSPTRRRRSPAQVKFPPGYYVTWSGQFEYLERAKARLQIVVPVTLLIIFLLLYLNFRRVTETLIVMLSLPFALVGGLWLMWWLGFNLSVAVAVGFIALAGVAAETGVVMLIYLDHALDRAAGASAPRKGGRSRATISTPRS